MLMLCWTGNTTLKKYHCVHFLIEAAQYLFEKDYSASFLGLTGDLKQGIQTSRDTTIKNKKDREAKRWLHCLDDQSLK